MAIKYFRDDEDPPWEPTVSINGVTPDFSADYTFTVTMRLEGGTNNDLEKTTNILGYADGVIRVNWQTGELDLEPGNYDVQLTGKHTSDANREFTVADTIIIQERLLVP